MLINKLPSPRILKLLGILIVLIQSSACVASLKMMGKPLTTHCIGTGITSVSASADSDMFVVSYCDDKKSLIAVGEYGSGQIRAVLSSNNSLYLKPILLNKNGDITFIERLTVDNSSIMMIEKNGLLTQLTNKKRDANNITDLDASPDGQTIYYVNSSVYRRYSPVGPYLPHDSDFCAVSISNKTVNRLSFSNQYQLSGISVSRDEKHIFSRGTVLHLDELKHEKLVYEVADGLPFTKNHLTYTSEFPLSRTSNQNQMVIACGKATQFRKYRFGDTQETNGYGLFMVQLPERRIIKELVYLPAYLDSPAIIEKESVVLFVRAPFQKSFFRKNRRELWSVNMDGSDLKRILLPGIE